MRSFRRYGRGEYQHEKKRRIRVKAKSERRSDVILRGEMIADYATILRYLQGQIPAARISHAEIIKLALSGAANDIKLRKRMTTQRKPGWVSDC